MARTERGPGNASAVEEAGRSMHQAQDIPAEHSLAPDARITPLGAIRAFGVVLGPSLLLDSIVGGSFIAASQGMLAKQPTTRAARLLRPLLAWSTASPAIYLQVVRPWLVRWGATDEEVGKPLLGDGLVPRPGVQYTRAITIDAPVEAVWPWLAQLGQDRGGFYSYEWLENLAGCAMHNADRIHPEWQQRAIGEVVRLHPSTGLKIALFEPNRALALAGWGTFVLEPIDEQHTRLIARTRVQRGLPSLGYALVVEIPHFIMERKMLLGIKERAGPHA